MGSATAELLEEGGGNNDDVGPSLGRRAEVGVSKDDHVRGRQAILVEAMWLSTWVVLFCSSK